MRDHRERLEGTGAVVFGVSTQDEDSHRRFAERYRLGFPQLADPDGTIAKDYGVRGGLSGLFGLAQRVSFVIDEEGRIEHLIDRPKVSDHGAELWELLKK